MTPYKASSDTAIVVYYALAHYINMTLDIMLWNMCYIWFVLPVIEIANLIWLLWDYIIIQ